MSACVLQVQVSIQFLSTLPQSSSRAAALHDLFVKMLADHLTETLYMSSMAELHCDIIGTDSSLVIKGATIEIKSIVTSVLFITIEEYDDTI